MSTPESPLSRIGPSFTTPVVETMPFESTRWSVRARRWQIGAVVIGLIVAAIGAAWVWGPTSFDSIDELLDPSLALAWIMLGGSLAYLGVRTQQAAPHQPYQLRPTNRPRNLFVIVWIVGLIAAFMLRMRLKSNILVILLLAAALGASGGMWAYRWFANKLREEWPIGRLAAPLAVPLRWPRSWVINWAGMWGVFSTSLALAFEIFWLWLVTQLFGPTLTDVFESAPLTRGPPGR